jgi:hypothetical protein
MFAATVASLCLIHLASVTIAGPVPGSRIGLNCSTLDQIGFSTKLKICSEKVLCVQEAKKAVDSHETEDSYTLIRLDVKGLCNSILRTMIAGIKEPFVAGDVDQTLAAWRKLISVWLVIDQLEKNLKTVEAVGSTDNSSGRTHNREKPATATFKVHMNVTIGEGKASEVFGPLTITAGKATTFSPIKAGPSKSRVEK